VDLLSYVVLILFLAGFLWSVILHEVAHGWVAKQCGDPTAEMAGRLTLNPIPHIDPVMTIIVPIAMMLFSGIIFGGAKPVPVNPYNFRNGEIDDLKVSLAGVGVNFSIAAVFGFSLHLWPVESAGFTLFALLALVNLVLGLFNLIPVPPLDGSHVMRFLLARIDRGIAESYERIGVFGLVILFLLLGFFWRHIALAIDFIWFNVFKIDVGWGSVVVNFQKAFS